jgi:26S proteasome regulatory subunit N2
MGLIMLGTASEKALEEMISYARETQHEKIIRSLAVGIAFVMYGTREKADGVINGLMEEKVSRSVKSLVSKLTEFVCSSTLFPSHL